MSCKPLAQDMKRFSILLAGASWMGEYGSSVTTKPMKFRAAKTPASLVQIPNKLISVQEVTTIPPSSCSLRQATWTRQVPSRQTNCQCPVPFAQRLGLNEINFRGPRVPVLQRPFSVEGFCVLASQAFGIRMPQK